MGDKQAAPPVVSPEKEGWLKKRGARMHRWSNRYFALCGTTLVYKLKKESTCVRRSFDLEAGCILTEVEQDEGTGTKKKGKQLYSFWIVWPQREVSECVSEGVREGGREGGVEEVSDDEDDHSGKEIQKPKDLKQIVRSEVITNRSKQRKAEEELEKHHTVDNNLSMGMKVAAVAVGGVVIGTLTLGIGLIPYMTVVGITAVASGAGVAYQYRRPSDARLILATESLSEALAWKEAIENQITKLEVTKCPRLPIAADPSVIASILGISTSGGGWFKVGQKEGIRIMEQGTPKDYRHTPTSDVVVVNGTLMKSESLQDTLLQIISPRPPDNHSISVDSGNASQVVCRKCQAVVPACPVNVFLALMKTLEGEYCWPTTPGSCFKVVRTIDDHADIIGVSVPLDRSEDLGKMSVYDRLAGVVLEDIRVEGCLSRFWKLDDDGSYVIFYNSTTEAEYVSDKTTGKSLPLKMDAVVSVAPRKDLITQENVCEMDVDVNECQVTISIQLQVGDTPTGEPSPWNQVSESTRNSFMNSFVEQILELRESIYLNRFDMDFDNDAYYANYSTHTHRAYSDDSRSSGGGSGGVVKKNRGGVYAVTTTQPMQDKARRVSGGGGGGGSDGFGSTSHTHSGAMTQSGGSDHASTPLSSSTTVKSKSRSQKLTNEVVHLRNHIASKEYELARLQKVMSKRKDSSGNVSVNATHSTSSPAPPKPPAVPTKISSKASPIMLTRPDASLTPTGSATLSNSNSNSNSGATALAASQSSLVSKQEQERMQQQVNRAHDLNEELNILKGRYFRLTGIDYDTQQSRRVVRRRGSKSGGPDEATVNHSNEVDIPKAPSKAVAVGHLPMTPAAKSLRTIKQSNSLTARSSSGAPRPSSPVTLANLSSLVYDSDACTPPIAPFTHPPISLTAPPYWNIIRNEMMKKQCAACNLQPYEKDVILFLLYFTVTLAFSMLYKQWM